MMECTTGLTDDEFDGLLAWLREEGGARGIRRSWACPGLSPRL